MMPVSTADFIEALKAEVSEDVFQRLMERFEPEIKQKLFHNVFGIKEAAAYLGCGVRTLQMMCKRKEIKFYRIGTEYRFRQSTLDEWMKEQEQEKERSK